MIHTEIRTFDSMIAYVSPAQTYKPQSRNFAKFGKVLKLEWFRVIRGSWWVHFEVGWSGLPGGRHSRNASTNNFQRVPSLGPVEMLIECAKCIRFFSQQFLHATQPGINRINSWAKLWNNAGLNWYCVVGRGEMSVRRSKFQFTSQSSAGHIRLFNPFLVEF